MKQPHFPLMLHILAAVAEFERELIRERAGVRNARQKGKRLGRPKRVFDRQRAVELRQQDQSLPQNARELGVGVRTVVRALDGQKLSKIPSQQKVPST